VHASTGSAYFSMADGSTIGGLLEVSASTGSATIAVMSGELAGGMSLKSSTGSANLTLSGTRIGSDIAVDTSTGSASVSLTNIALAANIDLNVLVSTGSIRLTVDQATNPGGNITASITTSTGSAFITYKGDDAFASAKFTTNIGSGSPHFTDLGGFTASGTDFQSINQLMPSRFDARVDTGTGSVYITGQMI